MIDITNNAGIIPINLGEARLQDSTHTLTHTYDLQPLIDNFRLLTLQYQSFVTKYPNITGNAQIQCKILDAITQNINNKIDNFQILNKSRKKRGLINGLGTALKFITGNLDSTDGDKINEIFNEIKTNKLSTYNALKYQISINEQLLTEYNKLVSTINHNVVELNSQFKYLSYEIKGLNFRELLNEMLIVYNMFLETFRSVENSLTFCKLNIFHPDIITSNILMHELNKISQLYPDQLLFPVKSESTINFETSLSTSCMLFSNKILFLISIPLYSKSPYNLFYLFPTPSYVKDELVILKPKTNYVIQNQNSISSLQQICANIGQKYHCSSEDVIPEEDPCIQDILLHKSTKSCNYFKVKTTLQAVTRIPHSAYILLYFPTGDVISITESSRTRTIHLKGLHVLHVAHNIIVKYKNKTILSSSTTLGQPQFIENLTFNFTEIPNVTLHLHPSQLIHLKQTPLIEFHSPVNQSVSYIDLIYVIIIFCISFIVILSVIYISYKHCKTKNHPNQIVTSPPINLRDVPI